MPPHDCTVVTEFNLAGITDDNTMMIKNNCQATCWETITSSVFWGGFRPTQKHPEIESFNSRFSDDLLN